MSVNMISIEDAMKDEKIKFRKKPVYEAVKRFMDILLSLIALLVLFIPLVIVAVILYIDDPGPIFFTQTRIGKNGEPFKIYKFRSMIINAEKIKEMIRLKNEDNGVNFKVYHDPRCTKFGMFMRMSSIDELPQLLNIIKGDMSIVGPRPFIPEEQEKLPSDRLLVRPGLSCYWQVMGKNFLPHDEQIKLDRKYIRERSLLIDLKIIFQTFYVVVKKANM